MSLQESRPMTTNDAYDAEGRVNWERMALIWQGKYFEALNELHKANKALARRRRYKQRQEYADWLEATTGMPTVRWVFTVENLVRKHSVPADDAPQRTYIYAVYAELLDMVRYQLRKHGGYEVNEVERVDVNIATARVMSGVLAAWAIAVTTAKGFDPARKVEDRQGMLRFITTWRRQVANAILRQPLLRAPWGGQEWENPFDRFSKGVKK